MSGRYLVVSLGSIGRRHLQNLRRLRPQARIGVLRLGGGEGEIPDGADAVFQKVDEAVAFGPAAAIVCCPASAHLRVATDLVKAGIAVLVEKPLAHMTRGVDGLLALARSRGVPVMTAYNLRFLPSLAESRRLVRSGAIGNVLGVRAEVGQYLPDWRPSARYQDSVSASERLGGGALLELSHEIDYVTWIMGMPARVTACGGRFGALEIDVEDMVSLSLEYDQPRVLASIHLDFLQRASSRICKFIGSDGTLVWDGMAETIALYRADIGEWRRTELRAGPDKNVMYLDELSHFLEAVENGTPVMIDGEQGLQVLRIVEAAKRSIATRSAVEL
jgi:predicted dehydrogenase